MAAAPVALVRGAIDAATAATWLSAIDAHPAWRSRAALADDAFNVESSSLRVAAIASLDVASVARQLMRDRIDALRVGLLGDEMACDVDQCWVRRQYAPLRYPAGHAPHAWHQDGALGFDFLARAPGDADLLPMLTCWIALTPCGIDAPGLEWVDDVVPRLLSPHELRDSAIRAAHADSAFRRPALRAGDCLAFGGGVLHHTHVLPSMRHDRTSLEIRLFDAGRIPERLRGDRFVAVQREPQGTLQ